MENRFKFRFTVKAMSPLAWSEWMRSFNNEHKPSKEKPKQSGREWIKSIERKYGSDGE